MFGDTQITIAGNLADDPELRFTPAGQPVARFHIASTPRFRDNATGEWKDGDSQFLTVNVWRQAAENVAESLTRGGTRAIVSGRLRQRSYETKEGEKRTVYEVEADEVGPSLKNAAAKVTKATRTGASSGGGGGRQDQGQADPWRATARAATATSRLSRAHSTERPFRPRRGGRFRVRGGGLSQPPAARRKYRSALAERASRSDERGRPGPAAAAGLQTARDSLHYIHFITLHDCTMK